MDSIKIIEVEPKEGLVLKAPEYYDDGYYEDCCDEGILEPMQSAWEEYIKSRESDYLLHKRFPNDYDLPF